MNWEQIQSKWQDYKDHVKQRWGMLTDQDFTVINGRRAVLAGKLLERSGAREKIEKEIAEFETTCKVATPTIATPTIATPTTVATVGETPAAGTA
jgi:uncharacterized protein YjbJ (UPF0337 family)